MLAKELLLWYQQNELAILAFAILLIALTIGLVFYAQRTWPDRHDPVENANRLFVNIGDGDD